MGLFWSAIRPPAATQDADEFFTIAQTNLIVQCAFFEAIAIYGLVLKILTDSATLWLCFIGAGAFLLSTRLPVILGVIERYKKLSSR